MISVEQFKKALGPTAELLTAEQIERLRDVHYGIANALFDSWLKKERDNPANNGKMER